MNNHPCNKQCTPPKSPCECIPPNYPYNRPVKDSYTFCCCGSNPNPPLSDYPTCGPLQGSAFALKDATPYLYDSTYMSYGQVLTMSENVYTKITQRDDPSCINLTARFDMRDTNLVNTVRFDFLKNYTARKYEELSGVLPIIKRTIKFKIYYTITDIDGGIVDQSHVTCEVGESHFHFTEVRDMFIQSAQGLIIDNIPAMTYQGLYTITIRNVEAYLHVINTKEHLQDALNPFYSFTDNNMKIALQNTVIENTSADEEILFAECDVNKSFDYRANVTTRLKISFIAFTSIPIVTGDTSPIWFALNEPTEQTITQLRNEVTAMEDEIKSLRVIINEQGEEINSLKGQVELNKNNITNLTLLVKSLEQSDANQNLTIEALIKRIEALEAIPLALVSYKADKEIKRSQLTYQTYGELYQAAETFTASGDFMSDVNAGYLVPISENAGDLSELIQKVNQIETTVNESYTNSQINKLLEDKVDKIEGKGLSSNDYTDDDKQLLHTLVTRGQIVFDTKDNFPNPGVSDILYVAKDVCLTYLWDDTKENYVCLNNLDVEQIKPVIEDEVQTAIENNATIVELTDRVENLETKAMSWTNLGG